MELDQIQETTESFVTEFTREYKIAEPSYYDRIPAILDYLTYITSETDKHGVTRWFRRRLSPTTKEVYRAIKKSSGKDNKCWKTLEHLAEQVGCCRSSVIKAKWELSQSFEQLQGNSLINIEIKRFKSFDASGQNAINTREIHTISIEYIWGYNEDFMRNGCPDSYPLTSETLKNNEAELAIEKMRQPTIEDLVHKSGAESTNVLRPPGRVHKRTPLPNGQSPLMDSKQTTKPDYIIKEQDYTADAASVLHINNLLSAFDQTESAETYFLDMGCTTSFVRWMISNYSLGDLLAAVLYVFDCDKKKKISNIQAYLRQTLQKRWHLKAKC